LECGENRRFGFFFCPANGAAGRQGKTKTKAAILAALQIEISHTLAPEFV